MENLIGPGLTLAIVVIGMAVAWGKMNTRQDAADDRINQMVDMCLRNRTACQSNNQVELARLAKALEELTIKKEHRWEELDRSLSSIDKFMGRVEQYMIMRNGGDAKHQNPSGWGSMR